MSPRPKITNRGRRDRACHFFRRWNGNRRDQIGGFEAFLRTSPGPDYYEFNFAPSTQWAAYRFDSYRSGIRVATEISAPRIEVRSSPTCYRLQASLEMDQMSSLRIDGRGELVSRRFATKGQRRQRDNPIAPTPVTKSNNAAAFPLMLQERRDSGHQLRSHLRQKATFKSPSLRLRWAPALNHLAKKSTTPVSRLYIAPATFIAPFDSISASTGLSLRMSAIAISTFLRATASTNA
jgi:hypothetical protein